MYSNNNPPQGNQPAGIFGQQQQGQAGGIFSQPVGGMFSQTPQQGAALFGQQTQQNPPPAQGGIFSQNAPQSGGLFQQSQSPALLGQQQTAVFPQQQAMQTNTPNIFGAMGAQTTAQPPNTGLQAQQPPQQFSSFSQQPPLQASQSTGFSSFNQQIAQQPTQPLLQQQVSQTVVPQFSLGSQQPPALQTAQSTPIFTAPPLLQMNTQQQQAQIIPSLTQSPLLPQTQPPQQPPQQPVQQPTPTLNQTNSLFSQQPGSFPLFMAPSQPNQVQPSDQQAPVVSLFGNQNAPQQTTAPIAPIIQTAPPAQAILAGQPLAQPSPTITPTTTTTTPLFNIQPVQTPLIKPLVPQQVSAPVSAPLSAPLTNLTQSSLTQPQQSQQSRVQPLRKDAVVSAIKIDMPDIGQLLRDIVHFDNSRVFQSQHLSKKETMERLITNTSFYKLTGIEVPGITIAPENIKANMLSELRNLVFENKMPPNQLECLYNCLKFDQKQRLEHDYREKKGNFHINGRQYILNSLCEQRLLVLQSITKILEKPCYLDETLLYIGVQQNDELLPVVLKMLNMKVQDPNVVDKVEKSLLEFLIASFMGAETQLDFYMKHLADYSQYSIWQMFNFLAMEQLEIIRIFVYIAFYYAEFDVTNFGVQVKDLLKTLKNSRLIGICNSQSVFKYLYDQQKVQNLQYSGDLIKKASIHFLISITKLPGHSDFLMNLSDSHKLIIRCDNIRRSLRGTPGFLVFYLEPQLINEISAQFPPFARMVENLALCFRNCEDECLETVFSTTIEKKTFLDRCDLIIKTLNKGCTLDEIYILAADVPDSQAFCYAIQRGFQQFICIFLLSRPGDELDSFNEQLTDILCKLLKHNNMFVSQFWDNYNYYNDQKQITGDVLLFDQIRQETYALKLLTALMGTQKCNFEYVCQRSCLDNIVNTLIYPNQFQGIINLFKSVEEIQPLAFSQIIAPLIKFAIDVGQRNQQSLSFQDGLDRRSMASMEYYSQYNYNEPLQQPRQQKQSQTIISEAATEEALRVLQIVKFLENLCYTDASRLKELEFSLGLEYIENSFWLTSLVLLRALTSCTSWGYQALQVSDKRANDLVVTLFRICKHILCTMNALLIHELTSHTSAYVIGLFGQLINKTSYANSQYSQRSASWHPLLELQDLINRYEANQIQGVNPYLEKKVSRTQAQLLVMMRTIMLWPTPTEFFPPAVPQTYLMDRQENEIEVTLESLQAPLQNFLRHLGNMPQLEIQNESSTRSFPQEFEFVLKKLISRRYGVRTELLQNLVDTLTRVIISNYPRYINSGTAASMEVLEVGLDILQGIFGRFIVNPCRYGIQQNIIAPLESKELILRRLLSEGLNTIDPEILLWSFLTPLELQFDKHFFDDQGQSSVGPKSTRNVGLINQLWASLLQLGPSADSKLKTHGYQVILNSISCFSQLLRLSIQYTRDASDPVGQIQVVTLLDRKMIEKQLYFFKAIYQYEKQENTQYLLSIVHSLLACLNINYDEQSQKTLQGYQPFDNPKLNQTFELLEITNEDIAFRTFLAHRGITRSRELNTNIISTTIQCLSILALSFSSYNHEERLMEDLIVHLRGDRMLVCPFKHILSQFNTSLMRVFQQGVCREVFSVLEFISICIDRKQTVLNQLLRPQGQQVVGVELFIRSLSEVKDIQCSALERQHLNLLTVSLLHHLLVRENHYSKFSELIKEKYLVHFIDILKSVLEGFKNPLQPLSNLLLLVDDHQQSDTIGITLSRVLEQIPDDEVTHQDIFTQLVFEHCVVGAINQTKALEYFIKVLFNSIKSNDPSKEQVTRLLSDFFQFYQPWTDAMIQIMSLSESVSRLLERVNGDHFIKESGAVVQLNTHIGVEQEWLGFMQLNPFGPGRDAYIDPQEFLSVIRTYGANTAFLERWVYTIQRINMVEGLYQASVGTFQQVHALLQLVVASGTDGIPLSCTASNSVMSVNSFQQQYLNGILQVFNSAPRVALVAQSEYDEKFRQSSTLAKSIIIPNHSQTLVPRGFVGVLTQETRKDAKTVTQAYRRLLNFLKKTTDALVSVINQGLDFQRLNSITPVFGTVLEIYAALQLLLDYESPHFSQGSELQHNEIQAKLVQENDLLQIASSQLSLWATLASQANNRQVPLREETQEALLQGFYYFMAYFNKALVRLSSTDAHQICIQLQQDMQEDLLMALRGLTISASRTMDRLGIYILSYTLQCTYNVFPNVVREFLFSETEVQDCTKLLLNRIRSQQEINIYYQSVITTWIILCQDSRQGLANYLLVKRNILEALCNHPNFMNIKEEPVYSVHSDGIAYTQNYKHIMWCYTLILLREGCQADPECLRLVLDFLQHHRARILSCILSLDHNRSFQQLQLFTQATQLTHQQIIMQQPGLQYLQELHLTLMLLTTLMHLPALKIHYPSDHDRLGYWLCNFVPAQLAVVKRPKLLFAFIKPFTQLECKLNQQDLAADGVKNEYGRQDRGSLEQGMSPRSTNNLANLRGNFNGTPRRTDLESRSITRTTQFMHAAGATLRLDQELMDMTPFQMLLLLELVNVLVAGGLGLNYALRQRDIAESVNVRAQLSLPLEPNYWIDLGENIVRFVHINLELLVNVSRFGNIQGLLNYTSLVQNCLDYQIQQGGLNQMSSYPKTKEELIKLIVTNIIIGLESGLQHLNLRELYRQIRFVRDSNEMEQVFAKRMCQLVDTVSQDQEIMNMDSEYFPSVYKHNYDNNEIDYWMAWKELFNVRR